MDQKGNTLNPKKSSMISIQGKNQTTGAGMNTKSPEVFVKKWVDYSSKYGLGYLLSNGSSGVFFNDCTKIVVDPSKEYFEYMERRASDRVDVMSAYSLKAYPKELHKKVTLLQHFRSYLEGIRTQVFIF